jgi:penicillin-binding protein-related factor A (putative recombinase)
MSADAAWKKAQNKVKEALKLFESQRKDFWYRAFVDTYAARGEIVQEQPADFWALYKGHYQLIEVKSCHQARFPFQDVRPSQWAGIRRAEAAGGSAYFLIVKL